MHNIEILPFSRGVFFPGEYFFRRVMVMCHWICSTFLCENASRKKSALSKKIFLGTKNKDINHPLGSSRQQGLILKRLGPTKSRQQDTLFWPESSPQPTPLLPLSNVQYMPIIQEGSSVGSVAYVASVSNWVSAQKLEQEQKNKKEGERGGEKRKSCFLLSPPPTLSFLFFALVSTFSPNLRGTTCYAGY